jgi:hypothetical protein
MKIIFDNGRWNFTTADNAGWLNMGFELNGQSCSNYAVSRLDCGLDAVGSGSGWGEELQFRYGSAPDSLIVRRFITNTGTVPLVLESINDGRINDGGEITLPGIHEYTLRCVHTANVRTEKYPDSRPEYPYVKPVPYQPFHFGIGEGNHVPALIITDEDYSAALVEGDLNQTRFERTWWLGLDGAGEKGKPLIRTYQGIQTMPLAAAPCKLNPGESIEVSRVFYQILKNTHPQDALTGYVEELNLQHVFAGAKSPMLHGSVFCTWNYGTRFNIDEQLLAGRARSIAERVPECTHFLIDDGYQADRGKRNGPLDCFYPDPAERYDRQKFPSGMKAMADTIRNLGLLPCIWLSPAVYLDSPLAMEHPDWLLCDENGDAGLLGRTTFLDPSVPEAWKFLMSVFDALFIQWGYKGIKFDFMTHWFTLQRARYRNGGSGPEWRDRIFHEIRNRIGEDGLFMTCIAMTMGNPFPGLNADCYRCGCDIHDGTWAEQLKACKATLPQILLEGRKTFLLNMDSAGFGSVPENEQIFRLTWVFITQGIIELGGPVESMPDRQIALWRKLLADVDRGHKVRCLDDNAFTGDGFPEILKVEYPEDSITFRRGVRAHIAFFNWEERSKYVGAGLNYLGIDPAAKITNFWTGETLTNQTVISDFLSPHTSRLIEVSI